MWRTISWVCCTPNQLEQADCSQDAPCCSMCECSGYGSIWINSSRRKSNSVRNYCATDSTDVLNKFTTNQIFIIILFVFYFIFSISTLHCYINGYPYQYLTLQNSCKLHPILITFMILYIAQCVSHKTKIFISTFYQEIK